MPEVTSRARRLANASRTLLAAASLGEALDVVAAAACELAGARRVSIQYDAHERAAGDSEEGEPLLVAASGVTLVAYRGGGFGDEEVATLEHLVHVAALAAARLGAEERSKGADDFVRLVAHELRSPLNAILGWARMLRSSSLAPSDRERGLETIERNGNNQARLIADLLDLTRIAGGRVQLVRERVRLDDVVETAVRAARAAAEAKGTWLEVERGPRVELEVDRERVEQALGCLLANAIRHAPAATAVRIEVTAAADEVRITVRDSGPGVDPEYLKSLNERRRPGSGPRGVGIGCGVPLARGLLELHGGRLVLESTPGRGTAATASLPRLV